MNADTSAHADIMIAWTRKHKRNFTAYRIRRICNPWRTDDFSGHIL